MSAQTLTPGQEGEIKATFNTHGKSGAQVKTITVSSNDPNNGGSFVYKLEGTIQEAISVNPGSVSFRAKLKEVVTEKITIMNNTDSLITLQEPQYPDSETVQMMTVAMSGKKLKPKETVTATVTFNAKTAGRIFKTFTVGTSSSKMPQIFLRVNAFVEDPSAAVTTPVQPPQPPSAAPSPIPTPAPTKPKTQTPVAPKPGSGK